MNTRGQYGNVNQGRVRVGARLVHTLELKQRYDNVKTGTMAVLLRELAKDGTVTSTGTNRGEIALREGAWVLFTWYPDYSALEITITDRELRPVDQIATTRRRYEAVLRKITPWLRSFGATTVGAAIYAPHERLASVDVGFVGLPIAAALYVFSHHGDEDAAVEQINTEFDTLNSELLAMMGVDPAAQKIDPQAMARDPIGYAKRLAQHQATKEKSRVYPFYRDVFDPKYRAWRKFYTDQSRFAQFWTSWNEYEQWRTHVVNLRAGAKALGVSLKSADPLPFGKTLLQKAADLPGKIIKPFGEAWDLVKYGLWAVLGIGAVVAISSVASNLRSGKDPGEKYVEMIQGRRSRASRALPARRAQLALPSGEPEDA